MFGVYVLGPVTIIMMVTGPNPSAHKPILARSSNVLLLSQQKRKAIWPGMSLKGHKLVKVQVMSDLLWLVPTSGVKSRRLAEVKVRELTQYSHELAALPG